MEKQKSKEIIINGAGLAGLTAAINLAGAGYKVKVFEKKDFIGQQKKETVQLLPNWFSKKDVIEELKECDIKVNWKNKISEIEIYLGKTKVLIYSKENPIGYTVLRGGENSFEKDLARQAIEKGVEIIFGKESKEKPDIIATGLGRILTVGYGQVYKGDFKPDKAKVFLAFDFSPTIGYGYFFPHNKKLATLKISRKLKENIDLKQNLEKIKKTYLEKEIRNENFLYDFGTKRSFEIPKTAIRNQSLLVGEAAGFQDELFRFGIRYAIISGFLAAKSIIENKDYDKLWKKRFQKEFQKIAKTRKVFCDFKEKRFNILSGKSDIFLEIEKFKRVWISFLSDIVLDFYPFLNNRFFINFLLKLACFLGFFKRKSL